MRNHVKPRAFELADEVGSLDLSDNKRVFQRGNLWADFPDAKSSGFGAVKYR
jgi:hypothetical protein